MNADLDLTIERVIRAPLARVWSAWADPEQFARWWVPAPARCAVAAMDLRPGGAFETRISEEGGPFLPHISGCFLAVEPLRRIVWTNALVAGWRPAEAPFITAVISFEAHDAGTRYSSYVMHKDKATRQMHEEAGFFDGWGTVIGQMAQLVEG